MAKRTRIGATTLLALVASWAFTAAWGRAATISVGRSPGAAIQSGYLGLSMEIRGIEAYTGYAPRAINPVFEQLVRNLTPGQRPVLRLGGDTADWSWYPIAHMGRPLGVRYSLTPTWMQVMRAMSRELDAKLIVGLDLEVNSARVAATEARAILSGIGSHWVSALELGNEPELYDVLAWFAVNNVPHYGRPAGWNIPAYLRDYASIARTLPDYPLAGPDVGVPPWIDSLGQFLSDEPHVRIVTVHHYALDCIADQRVPVSALFSDASTRQFAAGFGPAVAAARSHHVALRMDEMNSVSCGGKPGVSNTFAAALWDLDVMFELAHAGFDGVNIHTRPGNPNQLFAFTRVRGAWEAQVEPNYYGLLAFAQAAPAGSRLLDITGPSSGPLHAWAVRAPDGSKRIVLINTSMRNGDSVIIHGIREEAGTPIERLSAPSASATGGVTLGGKRFADGTKTGELTGALRVTYPSWPRGGGYQVWVPPTSAAILTIGPRIRPQRAAKAPPVSGS
jgi:hypothetical protein